MTQDRTRAIVEAAEKVVSKFGIRVVRVVEHGAERFQVERQADLSTATYDAEESLYDLGAALVLPEQAPAEGSPSERIETLIRLVDLTHKNAARSLQETAQCVTESLAEIRSALASEPPSAQWTSTAPSANGRYWVRENPDADPFIVERLDQWAWPMKPAGDEISPYRIGGRPGPDSCEHWQWFSVRIEEPPA